MKKLVIILCALIITVASASAKSLTSVTVDRSALSSKIEYIELKRKLTNVVNLCNARNTTGNDDELEGVLEKNKRTIVDRVLNHLVEFRTKDGRIAHIDPMSLGYNDIETIIPGYELNIKFEGFRDSLTLMRWHANGSSYISLYIEYRYDDRDKYCSFARKGNVGSIESSEGFSRQSTRTSSNSTSSSTYGCIHVFADGSQTCVTTESYLSCEKDKELSMDLYDGKQVKDRYPVTECNWKNTSIHDQQPKNNQAEGRTTIGSSNTESDKPKKPSNPLSPQEINITVKLKDVLPRTFFNKTIKLEGDAFQTMLFSSFVEKYLDKYIDLLNLGYGTWTIEYDTCLSDPVRPCPGREVKTRGFEFVGDTYYVHGGDLFRFDGNKDVNDLSVSLFSGKHRIEMNAKGINGISRVYAAMSHGNIPKPEWLCLLRNLDGGDMFDVEVKINMN